MSKKKQPLRTGEKILFSIVGVFFVLATIGYIALETIRLNSDKPMFETKTHFNLSKFGQTGSVVFRESRCTSCHRALRNGTNMGLSLDGIGSKRTLEWITAFLKEPEKTYNSVTIDHGDSPKEAAYVAKLPDQDLQSIAMFLSELKADQGSSSAHVPPKGRSEFIDNMVKIWAPDNWKGKYQDIRTKQPDEENRHD